MPIAAVLGSLLLGDTGAEAVIVTFVFRLGRAAEQRAATAAAKVQAMGMELNLEQRTLVDTWSRRTGGTIGFLGIQQGVLSITAAYWLV